MLKLEKHRRGTKMSKTGKDWDELRTQNLKELGHSFLRCTWPRLPARFMFLTIELSSPLVFCFALDLRAFLNQLKHEETNYRTRLLFSGTSPMWKKSWLGYETRNRWSSLMILGAPSLVRDKMKYILSLTLKRWILNLFLNLFYL